MNKAWAFPLALILLLLVAGCAKESNVLSSEEKADGWKLLFDGKTLNNWHVYNKGQIASEWSVMNGEIFCNPDSPDRQGDLVTDSEYENYDLQLDWKLSDKGNSGIFINVVEADTLIAAWVSGPEYQLLDVNHKDFKIPTKRSGCLYSLSNQLNEVKMAPGQWNHTRIVQNNGKVQFYLNDVLTAEMNFLSPAWSELVKNSGFARYPLFGKATKGKIALQDWASGVSFKNIKIKEIKN
jgi:hypothetical protein